MFSSRRTTDTATQAVINRAVRTQIDKLVRAPQRRWLSVVSDHPKVAFLGSRQLGKDRICGGYYPAVRMVLEPGTEYHCLSATQYHSNYLGRELRRFVSLVLSHFKSERIPVPTVEVDNTGELTLSNGSSYFSHPATPKASQGVRGNVILNEIGIMPRAEEVYETASAVVDGQLDQGRRASFVIMGNASRRGSFWHNFWTGDRSASFRKILATFDSHYTEWLQSLGATKDQIKAQLQRKRQAKIKELGPAAYAQWYRCQFRADDDVLLSAELIEKCQWTKPEPIPTRGWVQCVGYDVGRVRDPSAFYRVLIPPGRKKTPRYAVGGHRLWNKPYKDQRIHLKSEFAKVETLSAYMDATGNDDHAIECRKVIGSRLVGIKFNRGNKWRIFSQLKDDLERGHLLLDPDDTDLLIEAENIGISIGSDGTPIVDLPRIDDAHGDLLVALALANYAASHMSTGKVRTPKSEGVMPKVRW